MKGENIFVMLASLHLFFPRSQAQPTIIEEPQSRIVAPGAAVAFHVNAAGIPPLYYQWQFNGDDIPRATAKMLSFQATPARAGIYSAVVRDASGNSSRSGFAMLEVQPRPTAVAQPKNVVVGEHGTAVFEVRLNDSGPYSTIVWHNSNRLEGSHIIPDGLGFDVHGTRLEIPDCQDNDFYNGVYWLSVTNAVGGTVSQRAKLTVVGPPRLIAEPQDRVARRGGAAAFSITVAPDAAGPKLIQWYHNGEPMPGRTLRRLIISHCQDSDAGFYHCVVTSIGGSTASYEAQLSLRN